MEVYLHAFWISVLPWGELLASRKTDGGWIIPKVGLGAWGKRNISCTCEKRNFFLNRPAQKACYRNKGRKLSK